jgi:hypothetical protein
MPQQELFFEQTAGDRRIEVLKTYDQKFAREAFADMGEAAQAHLWTALKIEESCEAADIPGRGDPGREDFLWQELLEASREEGNISSFFVVTETQAGRSARLYVSPDWPSAQAFAGSLIAAA